jgi:hypothetical protein
MKRLWTTLLGMTLMAGCATVGSPPARVGFSDDGELAEAVRLCSWGNGAACDDLAVRLQPIAQDDARARAAAAVVERVRRDDAGDLARTVGACRDGSISACDRVAAALTDGVTEAPGHCRVAAALPDAPNTRVATMR